MKDIGILFKEKREEIGIKIEEAANDMDVTVAQLDNLENGNVNAFKDIFFLKDLIKKYAKYLNVDENEVMDDFNDFVFDYTSKIPVAEIEEKIKEIEKEQDKEEKTRISSPYTKKKVRKAKIKPVVYLSIITIILVCITLIIMNLVLTSKKSDFSAKGCERINELA